MKEEEKKEETPVAASSGLNGEGTDLDQSGDGVNSPIEGEEDDDDDKGKDPLPGEGSNGPIRG